MIRLSEFNKITIENSYIDNDSKTSYFIRFLLNNYLFQLFLYFVFNCQWFDFHFPAKNIDLLLKFIKIFNSANHIFYYLFSSLFSFLILLNFVVLNESLDEQLD